MNRKNSIFIQIISTSIFLMGLLIFIACGKNSSATLMTRDNMDNELRIALTGNVNTLDPQETSATITAQVVHSIYEGLLDVNGMPVLAKKWESTDEGLVWFFSLQQGIYFHHGKAFKAEDVIATFQRIKDASVTSHVYGLLDNITDMIAIDDYTVRLTLAKKDNTMPDILASNELRILPADLIHDETHNFSTTPVGTGAFSFDEWIVGEKIVLKRNHAHPTATTTLEKIEFYFMSDINVQMTSIINASIDIVPYIIEPQLSLLEKQKHIQLKTFPTTTISVLAMNTRTPPLNSLAFRTAVAQSINKDEVITYAYPSGKKTNYFWRQDSVYFTDIPEIYNPRKAKEFFESYNGKKDLTIVVPLNFAAHVRAGEMYQSQLEKVGLDVKIEKVNWSTWLDRVYGKGIFDMTIIGHTGKVSPYQRLSSFKNTGGYVGWKNDAFTRLMDSLELEYHTKEEETSIYKEIFSTMTNDYPFVFVVENSVKIGMRKGINNLIFDPLLETYDFSNVSITP